MSSHVDGVLKHFNYDHLKPGALRDTSRLFHDLAHTLATRLPASADTTIALRELLAAKDNAVRSMLAVTPDDEQAERVSDEELAGELHDRASVRVNLTDGRVVYGKEAYREEILGNDCVTVVDMGDQIHSYPADHVSEILTIKEEIEEPQLEGLQARYQVFTKDGRTLTAHSVAERSDGEEGTDVTFMDGITVSFGPGEITDIHRMVP